MLNEGKIKVLALKLFWGVYFTPMSFESHKQKENVSFVPTNFLYFFDSIISCKIARHVPLSSSATLDYKCQNARDDQK